MKTTKAILVLAGALFLLMYPISSKADIIVHPDTLPAFYGTTTAQPDPNYIAGLFGYVDTFVWLYKADYSPAGEEGSYKNSYNTTFTGDDPNNATVSYVGSPAPVISETPLFLLVKDGKANTTYYIFDLLNINTPGYAQDSWDGTENILIEGFWLGPGGAISNVAIVGPTVVPEPGILILLGLAMSAIGVASWKIRKL